MKKKKQDKLGENKNFYAATKNVNIIVLNFSWVVI